MDIEYPVRCPILKREISEGVCFDVHMVVAGEAPIWSAPEEIQNVEGYKQLCINCPYHRNV